MSESTGVVLSILNRNFKVSCEEHQMEDLCEAANYLTRQLGMLDAAGAGERGYISVALSMTYEHLRTKDARESLGARVADLNTRIDAYLKTQ